MKERWRAGERGRDCSHVLNGPTVMCILAVCTGNPYSRSGEGRRVGRREYWGSRGERMATHTPDLERGGG